MTGLATMLKAFGVNVTPEHIAAVERMIPQIPTIAKQVIDAINAALEKNATEHTAIIAEVQRLSAGVEAGTIILQGVFERLETVVAQNAMLLEQLKYGRTNSSNNSNGNDAAGTVTSGSSDTTIAGTGSGKRSSNRSRSNLG